MGENFYVVPGYCGVFVQTCFHTYLQVISHGRQFLCCPGFIVVSLFRLTRTSTCKSLAMGENFYAVLGLAGKGVCRKYFDLQHLFSGGCGQDNVVNYLIFGVT